MNIKLFLILMVGLSGCLGPKKVEPAKSDLLVTSKNQSQYQNLESLDGKQIKNFMVVIFPDNLSQAKWKNLFQLTDRMTALKYNADENMAEISKILIDLYDNYSSYLLQWNSTENCKFNFQGNVNCEPMYDIFGDNSLNGGLPEFKTPFELRWPETNSTDHYPWYETKLVLDKSRYGQFELTLKLKKEIVRNKTYYYGDVLVSPESYFLNEQGIVRPHFKIGYTELWLE